MAEVARIALAESQVTHPVAAALVHARLLMRLVAVVPSHAVQKALAPACAEHIQTYPFLQHVVQDPLNTISLEHFCTSVRKRGKYAA